MLAVVVIDSAEHTVLQALMAAGRAPNLDSLARRGASVPLRSDADVLDGSVFQTLLTGANPGEHGIYKYRQLRAGTYSYRRSEAAWSPVPQIWRVLSERGRRCCVFDVPKAHPVAGFNGRLLAAWAAYSPAARPASVPSGLHAELVRRFGRHPCPAQSPIPLSIEHYGRARDLLCQGADIRSRACVWMLGDGPWDFFMTAFCESHVAAHQFWHLRDPKHSLFDPAASEACAGAVEEVYEAIDAALGRVLETLPRGATVVVLTQQGVASNFSGSHLIPEWLARRRGAAGRRGRPGLFVRAAAALGPSLRSRLHRDLPDPLMDLWLRRKYAPAGDVFMLPGSEFMAMLRVNLQGREPRGTVAPGSYRQVIEALRDDLLLLRNPATGRAAVREVVFSHDRFHGNRLDALPDVIVCWAADAPIESLQCPKRGTITGGLRFVDRSHSLHTAEGLAFIAGPGVYPGARREALSMADLTATLYRLMGEGVPPHVEGMPLDLTASPD